MAQPQNNNRPKASEIANEALEALGSKLGRVGSEKSARVLVAWCWKRGIKSSAFVNTIALALKILVHSLPSDSLQAALEGAVEGIETRVETELDLLRRLPDDAARNAAIAEALGEAKPTDPHKGHDAGHGSHTTTSTAQARDEKTVMGYITRLPANKRQQAMDFWKAFKGGAPKVAGLIEQCQARDGFLGCLFERVFAFWDDQEFMAEAVRQLLGDELKAMKAEKDHKPIARMQHAIGSVFQALEDGMNAVGVPQIHDNNHDNNHTTDEDNLADAWEFLKR